MILPTKDFLRALEKGLPLTSGRSHIPILNTVRLEATGGRLTVYTTDLDAYVAMEIGCVDPLPPLCVNAKLLHGLCKNGGETIKLTLQGERLAIESNGRAMLPITPVDDFPVFPHEGFKAIGVPIDELHDAIQGTAWAADATRMSERANAASVQVITRPKLMRVTATRGYLASLCEKGVICAASEFLFPCDQASLLCDALNQPEATLHVSPKHVKVQATGLTVAVRQVDAPYFTEKSIDNVLKSQQTPLGELTLADFIPALDVCASLAAKELEARIDLMPNKKGGITISFIGKMGGTQYETTVGKGAYSFNPIMLNVNYLRLLLQHLQDSGPTIKATVGVGTLQFRCGDFINGLALITKDT